MRSIFSPAGLRLLADLSRSNALVGFDYDGTLAPIQRAPERAALAPQTRMLLAEVSERYPCAVISGRERREVLGFLRGIPLVAVVGNHGAEGRGRPRGVSRVAVLEWRDQMATSCADLEGVVVEDKTWSVSVHWRAASRRSTARARVLSAARRLAGARLIHGKDVVSIVSPDAADKGDALMALMERVRCDAAIYVGDDETDEDVFALPRRAALLTVRVGYSRRSLARFHVPAQARVDDLLATLISLRARPLRERASPCRVRG